tara:strand:+ start:731 stop:949 length:219 start_codon:yes stop_codon:yes gene_type:complete
MKVHELIMLLENENPEATVIVYLGTEEGWALGRIVMNDAIIGKARTNEDSFILIPVEVPDDFQNWADQTETK